MTTLTLAVPGLAEPPAPLAGLLAHLPPTPVLDRFRRATRRHASVPGEIACAGAATAALAGDNPDAGRWMRLDPVHLAPAADGLRLTAGPALALSSVDAAALSAHVAQALDLDVRCASPTAWYAPRDLDALAPSPRALAGEPLADALPADAALKRRLNDAQMSLHEHAVNHRRAAAGLPEVNGLWPWGGAPLERGAALGYARVYSAREELVGLQRAAGRAADAVPAHLQELPGVDDALVELLALGDASRAGSVEGWLDALATLERDWLGPAHALLDTRRIEALALVTGGRAHVLTRRSVWRAWRRGGFFDATH